MKIFNFEALCLSAQGAAADIAKISNQKSMVLYRLGQVSFEKFAEVRDVPIVNILTISKTPHTFSFVIEILVNF